MENKETSNTQLSLDRIIWLFEKQEKLRIHNTNRASTLIASNSIIIAANTFMLGRFWSGLIGLAKYDLWYINDLLVNIPIIVSFTLALFSIYHALSSFILHKNRSEDITGKIPNRFFVHSRNTINEFSNFKEFASELDGMTEDKLTKYLVSDFYSVLKIHEFGYQKLRISSKYFIRSLYFLFLNILISTLLPHIQRIL